MAGQSDRPTVSSRLRERETLSQGDGLNGTAGPVRAFSSLRRCAQDAHEHTTGEKGMLCSGVGLEFLIQCQRNSLSYWTCKGTT